MIADNYTVIGISFLLVLALLVAGKYFGGQLKQTFVDFKKAKGYVTAQTTAKPIDDEVYDDDDTVTDTTRYFGPGKKRFIKEMDAQYNEYNQQKSEYIKTTYNKPSDDVVDKSALYKKYDSYSYKSDS
jgi:hypothetical protein